MQSPMKSRILTDSFQCRPEMDGILLNDFHDANDAFRCSYEWKLIRKFQKWLYNLHMNPIVTRRNV